MVTLAQAKLNTQDKIVAGVIDEFRKSSFLLDSMIFDDAVAPSGNGATLTYGYTRLITQPTASFRAYNSEYTPQEVTKQRYSVDLKPFGGTFQIDRVLANVGGLVDEVNLQISQKIKATNALFNDALINGDSAVDANSFDGLNKAITGSSTEYNDSAFIDISDEANMNSNKNRLIDMLDEFLSGLDGEPTFIAGNSKLINKIKAIARRLGYFTQSEDAFGKMIDKYGNIPLVDLGDKAGSNTPVVPIVTRTVGTEQTGLTDLYVARIGLDGFHAVSLAGQDLVKVWLPDFSTAGAVKNGEVEMVATTALKSTKSAGVFRNIKVQ